MDFVYIFGNFNYNRYKEIREAEDLWEELLE